MPTDSEYTQQSKGALTVYIARYPLTLLSLAVIMSVGPSGRAV